AVDPRQHQVEQEQVGSIAADHLQAGVSPACGFDLEALFFEVVLQHLGDVRLVFDQENPFLRHRPSQYHGVSTTGAEKPVEKGLESHWKRAFQAALRTLNNGLCNCRKSLI